MSSSPPPESTQMYVTAKNSTEKIPIPADWKILSGLLFDWAFDPSTEFKTLHLIEFDVPEINLLIIVTDHIKNNYYDYYNDAIIGENNERIIISVESILFLNQFNFEHVKRAITLTGFLDIDLLKGFLMEYCVSRMFSASTDSVGIQQGFGFEPLTPAICEEMNLPKTNRLWDLFPEMKRIVFGET